MISCYNGINVAVIGGGNIGTQFACVCASKGHKVNILTSKPELFDGTIEIVDENNLITTGKLNIISDCVSEVISGCQIIFVTYPAFKLKEIANKMLPYITSDMSICVLPGTGGVEFSFKSCIDAGATVCGLQRVPSVARIEKYGKRVRCEGLRKELFLAAIPRFRAEGLAQFIEHLWEIPCSVLPNYLSVTLTPSNPILHTSRLNSLFFDYEEGKIYKRNPLFYGEWDNDSSDRLLACDQELQEMIKLLDKLDLSHVKSLKIHYEGSTSEEITQKLKSISSLHNIKSPMKPFSGGWIPDFESRYFMADFPYGLAILEELSILLNYNAENIRKTMDWYRKVTGNTNKLDIKDYGIVSIEDLYKLY